MLPASRAVRLAYDMLGGSQPSGSLAFQNCRV